MTVTGPLLSGLTPSTVELTIGGIGTGTSRPTQLSEPWKSAIWQYHTSQTVQFTMTGPELPLGTHRLSLAVRATNRELIGKVTERIVKVIPNFQYGVSAPQLVVGRRSRVSLSVDAPAGRQLTQCLIGFGDPVRGLQWLGEWCTNPAPALRVSPTVTPQLAGVNAFVFSLGDNTGTNTGYYTLNEFVYAARQASVSAPAIPYGVRGMAKVVVQDSPKLNKWSAAPTGVVVYLQRRAVGTTRWVTLGSAKTVARGIALIPFTSTTNGAFRAVLASTVPLETVISPATSAVSSATVGWRLAPRTATRGKAVTYQATATPYDVGSLAHLQVRKAGSTRWTTVKSVAVPKTRVVTFAYAFPGTGTWSVRVYRQATKQHALGLSTAVGVKVK